jgi:hypothetical protein
LGAPNLDVVDRIDKIEAKVNRLDSVEGKLDQVLALMVSNANNVERERIDYQF